MIFATRGLRVRISLAPLAHGERRVPRSRRIQHRRARARKAVGGPSARRSGDNQRAEGNPRVAAPSVNHAHQFDSGGEPLVVLFVRQWFFGGAQR